VPERVVLRPSVRYQALNAEPLLRSRRDPGRTAGSYSLPEVSPAPRHPEGASRPGCRPLGSGAPCAKVLLGAVGH
jgi:hypothetical protein